MEELTKQLEIEGHRTVDYSLFKHIMTNKMKEKKSESDLIKAFHIIDRDKSGSIDREEFLYVL